MTKREEDSAALHEIIFHASEAVRSAGILLQPIMPTKMGVLLDIMGVDANKRRFEDAAFGKDYTYGEPIIDPGRPGEWNSLFPPQPSEG